MWGRQISVSTVQYVVEGALKKSPLNNTYKKRQKWDTFWRQNLIFYIPYKRKDMDMCNIQMQGQAFHYAGYTMRNQCPSLIGKI